MNRKMLNELTPTNDKSMFVARSVAVLILLGSALLSCSGKCSADQKDAAMDLLRKISRQYRDRAYYADTGEVVITASRGGETRVVDAPAALAFIRPKKVILDSGVVAFAADSDEALLVNRLGRAIARWSIESDPDVGLTRKPPETPKGEGASSELNTVSFLRLYERPTTTTRSAQVVGAWASSLILALLVDTDAANVLAVVDARINSDDGSLSLRFTDGLEVRLTLDQSGKYISKIEYAVPPETLNIGGIDSLQVKWLAGDIITTREDVNDRFNQRLKELRESTSKFTQLTGNKGSPSGSPEYVPTPHGKSVLQHLRSLLRSMFGG